MFKFIANIKYRRKLGINSTLYYKTCLVTDGLLKKYLKRSIKEMYTDTTHTDHRVIVFDNGCKYGFYNPVPFNIKFWLCNGYFLDESDKGIWRYAAVQPSLKQMVRLMEAIKDYENDKNNI